MKPALTGAARASVIYCVVLSWMLPYFVAYNVQGLKARFGMNEAQAGWLVSIELFALAFSAMLAGIHLVRVDKRKVMVWGVLLSIASLALSLVSMTSWVFAITKIICGTGLGLLVAAAYAIPGGFANSERFYAHAAMAISIVYSAALFILPVILQCLGARGLEYLEIAMLMAGACCLKYLPNTAGNEVVLPATPGPLHRDARGKRMQLLTSIFVLFLAQSAAVAMVFTSATRLHIDPNQLATALMLSAMLQLPTGFIVAKMGSRLGMMFPIVLGGALLLGAYYSIFIGTSPFIYLVAVALLSSGVTFITPYLMSGLSTSDSSGKAASLGGALSNFGNAAGPALAGVLYLRMGANGLGWVVLGLLGVAIFMGWKAFTSSSACVGHRTYR